MQIDKSSGRENVAILLPFSLGDLGDKKAKGRHYSRLDVLSTFRRSSDNQPVIWIVEDDQLDRLIVSRMLGRYLPGVQCIYFDDVFSVVAHTVKSEGPSLVITDLKLLASDGLDLIGAIRRNDAFAHMRNVPILVLTGNDETGIEQRCREAGANAVIPKMGVMNDGTDLSNVLTSLVKNLTLK